MLAKHIAPTVLGVVFTSLLLVCPVKSSAQDSVQANRNTVVAETTTELTGVRLNEREMKIEAALLKPVKFDYFETRFEDVTAEISNDYKIPIVLAESATKAGGLDEEALITRRLENVSLQAALQIVLEPYECTFLIKDEVLCVASKAQADEYQYIRVYDCRTLADKIGGNADANYEKLINVLTTTVNAKSWEANGGSGSIAEIGGKLVVNQNSDGHQKIASILKSLVKEFAEEAPGDSQSE